MSGCPHGSIAARVEHATGLERAELLEHARACARCRAELVAEDPSRLFSLLAMRRMPVRVLDALSRDVALAIRGEVATPASLPASSARRALAWAAVLLLAVASGSLLLLPPVGPGRALPGVSSVEVLSSPGAAKVVDFTVGETQLVMIFDEGIEL